MYLGFGNERHRPRLELHGELRCCRPDILAKQLPLRIALASSFEIRSKASMLDLAHWLAAPRGVGLISKGQLIQWKALASGRNSAASRVGLGVVKPKRFLSHRTVALFYSTRHPVGILLSLRKIIQT